MRLIESMRPLPTNQEVGQRLTLGSKHLPTAGGAQASYCDKCLDRGGKPVVDLRDYKPPIIEVPDLDAVRVTFDLVSHDPAAKNRARARFGEPWSELGNGELFEAVLGLASALADEQAGAPSAKLRSPAALQAEFMSKVGRAFIDGKSGVDRLFSEARARSGYNGSAQTIGCLRAPSKISLLSDIVRLELRLAAERHFLSEPIRKTSKWDALAPEGFIALGGSKEGQTRAASDGGYSQ